MNVTSAAGGRLETHKRTWCSEAHKQRKDELKSEQSQEPKSFKVCCAQLQYISTLHPVDFEDLILLWPFPQKVGQPVLYLFVYRGFPSKPITVAKPEAHAAHQKMIFLYLFWVAAASHSPPGPAGSWPSLLRTRPSKSFSTASNAPFTNASLSQRRAFDSHSESLITSSMLGSSCLPVKTTVTSCQSEDHGGAGFDFPKGVEAEARPTPQVGI